jgi:hypothetical protein
MWPPMEVDLQPKTTSNGRWPPMEDDHKVLKVEDNLKISKFEYLTNHWLDLSQNLNLNVRNQTRK